jgi:lipid A 3-O-deacylase
MRPIRSSLSCLLLALGLSALPAAGQDLTPDPSVDPDWVVSVGGYDIIDGEASAELGIERRFGRRIHEIIPVVGLTVNGDGGFYVAGGARYDRRLGDRWVFSPHFAVTLLEPGDGRDIGSTVEFRSGLELAYRLEDRRRIGLSFYHLSNAGIDETNPGSESLVLTFSF